MPSTSLPQSLVGFLTVPSFPRSLFNEWVRPPTKNRACCRFYEGLLQRYYNSVKPQYPGWTALYPGWTARSPPDLCDRLLEGAVPVMAGENGQSSDFFSPRCRSAL